MEYNIADEAALKALFAKHPRCLYRWDGFLTPATVEWLYHKCEENDMDTFEWPAVGTFWKDRDGDVWQVDIYQTSMTSVGSTDKKTVSWVARNVGPLIQVPRPAPDFKPGQVWEDETGTRWLVIETALDRKAVLRSPTKMLRLKDFWPQHPTAKLVLDV